jgi:hypothetical protein
MISATSLPPFIPSVADRADNNNQAETLSRTRRNVGEPGKYWPQHSTIKISVFGSEITDPYVQAIKKAASHWLPHINLKFEFVSGEEGDVRIAMTAPGSRSKGSSAIGTDALSASEGYPTMTLPIDHTTPGFEHTVIHEFGHMLGAHHAHQHPDANIPWNMSNLKQLFTQQTRQDNFLALPRSDTCDFSPYDADSAMHYSTNNIRTTENTVHSRNAILSEGDIAWAKKAYPRDPATTE